MKTKILKSEVNGRRRRRRKKERKKEEKGARMVR